MFVSGPGNRFVFAAQRKENDIEIEIAKIIATAGDAGSGWGGTLFGRLIRASGEHHLCYIVDKRIALSFEQPSPAPASARACMNRGAECLFVSLGICVELIAFLLRIKPSLELVCERRIGKLISRCPASNTLAHKLAYTNTDTHTHAQTLGAFAKLPQCRPITPQNRTHAHSAHIGACATRASKHGARLLVFREELRGSVRGLCWGFVCECVGSTYEYVRVLRVG